MGIVLLWNLGEAALIAVTGGLACCITLPLNIIMVGTSVALLNNYIDQNPQALSTSIPFE